MRNKKVKKMMEDVHGIVFARSIHSVMYGLNQKQTFFKNDSKWKLRFNLTVSLTADQIRGVND